MNKIGKFVNLNNSKALRSLLVVSCTAASLVVAPQRSEAVTFPARGGSSGFFSAASCWSPYGPSMTNSNCTSPQDWYIPLTIDPAWTQQPPPPGYMYYGTATVWAEGATASNNVGCLAQGYDMNRTLYFSSGWQFLRTFGAPASIPMNLLVPYGGTGMIDCTVYPNGQVISASW